MINMQIDVENFGAGVEASNETGEVVSRTVQLDSGTGTIFTFRLSPGQAERLKQMLSWSPEQMAEENRRLQAQRLLQVPGPNGHAA